MQNQKPTLFNNCVFLSVMLAGILVCCHSAVAQPGAGTRSRPAVVTTNRPVEIQARRTFASTNGIYAGNDFPGAHLNDFRQTGPTNFTVFIKPENFPINDSAWFAFKIWSRSNQTVTVTLNYENGRHRYRPKISADGASWKVIPPENFQRTASNAATMTLHIGPKPVFVSGQELFTSKDFHRWIGELSEKPFVRSKTIGRSVCGKPIREFELSEAGRDASYLLIIGRQHPPEVTGTFALRAFVSTLCSDAPLSRRFRAKFKTVVIPLMNPDGVDAGHWRHNTHGVDLNRDWGQFNQQETRVARDEFLRIEKKSPGKIRFAMDFHSTQYDVFYPFYDSNPRNAELLDNWLKGIQTRAPDYKVNIEPSRNRNDAVTLVSVGWMNRQFGIPSVTYEVGDETDRAVIEKVATAAANSLMELLLEREK